VATLDIDIEVYTWWRWCVVTIIPSSGMVVIMIIIVAFIATWQEKEQTA
jgi:hypothetical protein